MTKVVHINDGYDTYIGRPSHFGNPFVIGRDGTREEVLDKFEEYFYNRLRSDKEFAQRVEELEGKRLGCFCKPNNRCHGDIIVGYLNDLKIGREIDDQDEFYEAQRESYLNNEI